jgi:hypothetical protein
MRIMSSEVTPVGTFTVKVSWSGTV